MSNSYCTYKCAVRGNIRVWGYLKGTFGNKKRDEVEFFISKSTREVVPYPDISPYSTLIGAITVLSHDTRFIEYFE